MVTIEEKLNIFTKLVLGEAQHEFNDKLKEIEKQNQEKIELYKQKLEEQEEKILQQMNKRGILERNKRVSKANLDAKRKVLSKQQELVERHIKNLKQMAMEFTESKDYRLFLEQSLSQIFSYFKDEFSLILFFTEKDIKRYSDLAIEQGKKFGFKKEQISIQIGEPSMIGGVQGINQGKVLRLDLSMSAMIEQHQKKIGQKLYDVLKEAGGIDE